MSKSTVLTFLIGCAAIVLQWWLFQHNVPVALVYTSVMVTAALVLAALLVGRATKS